MRLISLTALACVFAGPAAAGDVEAAASDAIGIFCVPVLISGQLAAADLIEGTGFVSGTQEHPEVLSTPSFHHRFENGDVVEVFIDTANRQCTVHVHGSKTVMDAYFAAIRAQRWGLFVAPSELDTGATISGWRVNFGRGAGGAMQAVVTAPPDNSDPAKPQVIAVFTHTD